MVNRMSRRRILGYGVLGLASVAGCQTPSSSEAPIVIHFSNSTEKSREAYVELVHFDSGDHEVGRVFTVEAGTTKKIDFTVKPTTYLLKTTVDDVTPRPERTSRWEVTEDECTKSRYCVLAPAEEGVTLRLMELQCTETS